MTLAQPARVTCPECGAAQDAVVHSAVNVTTDPDLKDSLFRGALNTVSCAGCARTVQIAAAVLYHDMRARLLVQCTPGGRSQRDALAAELQAVAGPMAPGYRVRQVFALDELIEKVRVFDAGLDDRAVEVVKVLIHARCPPDLAVAWILYAGRRDAEPTAPLVFWIVDTAGQQHQVESPWAVYARVAADVAARAATDEAHATVVIDQDYAQRFVERR